MKDRQLLLAIMAQLEREKIVSIPQLAMLLGVEEQRVFDALEVLVFAYDAASIRLDLHDSYATLQMHGTDRLLRLTATEADALVDALTAAGFSDGDRLVDALLQTKGVLDSTHAGSGPRLRVISEAASPDVAQTIAAACEDAEHHLLEIEYRGTDDIEARTRRVEPLRIFSEDGHRYVQAYCRNSDGWRSFRIDRILRATPLEERFASRDDAPRPRVGLDHAAKARIRLDADFPLPAWRSLRVVSDDEAGRIVEVPWTGSSWLPKQVVSLMGQALALEPAEFVHACKECAEKLLQP